MATEDRLKAAIESVKKSQERANKAAEETEDVKSGKCTAEDEKKEPGFVLFNQITASVIETLQKPEIIKTFNAVGEKIGEQLASDLVMSIAICCATSAHNAITFYDDLLKKELNVQFDSLTKHVNMCKGDLTAYQSVLQVFKARLDKIEEPMKVSQAMRDAGIPKQENT